MKSDIPFSVEHASWPVLVLDDAGLLQTANGPAKKLFGAVLEGAVSRSSAIWSSENELIPELFLARSERTAPGPQSLKLKGADGKSLNFQSFVTAFTHQGHRCYVVQLFPAEVIVKTEAKPAAPVLAPAPPAAVLSVDASLAQKQKLDCALQLTRTVALDFNNALTSILGHTSLILGKMQAGHPWRNSLVQVEKSAEKAAEIAHDLAAFSRQEKDTRGQTAGNINDLVRRTIDLFKAANPGIVWDQQFESKLYSVNFDEAKMQQAFVKIVDNAVQAIGAKGRISIVTKNHDLANPLPDGAVTIQPGNYLSIEFTDDGCGIAPEVLPKIFDPFFTTKKPADHRGLGLAFVYGIVTNHGGSVAVSSQVGQGTTVRVYLPAQKKIVKDRSLRPDDLGGTQTILMVDDEELLLTMGEMVLSSFGYTVWTANSGQKALEIFTASSDQIDLVITDLVMPQMSGREVIERLRQISPTIKIISASGFMRSGNPVDDEAYLQKPFTSQDLLRKVKQVLSPADST